MNKFAQTLRQLNDKSCLILANLDQLTYIGDPVLRQKTKSGTFEESVAVGKRLVETLLAYRKLTGLGRGLAAPQIGESIPVFVTYVNDRAQIYINPEIVSQSSETNLYKECCISSQHLWCDVRRSQEITMSFLGPDNHQVTEHYDGFMARLLQHEYDHLQGVVNLDRAVSGTIDYCFGDPLQEKLRD